MDTANQTYSKKEESKILYDIYCRGDIPLQEFLEFSDLSFSKKLLERVKERMANQPPPEVSVI
jgi:hypothetical protein